MNSKIQDSVRLNIISKYFLVYIIALVFGWIVESISKQKPFCFSPFDLSCVLKGIFLNGHGIFLVLITFIYRTFLSKYINISGGSNQIFSLFLLFVVLFVFVGLFECIMGQVSYLNYGVRTWNYDKFGYAICDGYIALFPTLFFSFMLLIYFIFIYPMIFGQE